MDASTQDLTRFVHVADRSSSSPVILHVPHASRTIPEQLRASFVVPWEEVESELDAMTDGFTDRIAAAVTGASRIEHVLSRLLVDVERFPGDEEEMNRVGMGVLYTHGSRGQELRRPSPADRAALLDYFEIYSTTFADLVSRTLERHGLAVIIDIHSYPKVASPYELHADERRPQLCAGADLFHTPPALVTAVHEAFSEFELLVNEPFHGGYVPLRYYERDKHVQSVMLEIRRDLYLGSPRIAIESAIQDISRRVQLLVDILADDEYSANSAENG